MCSSLLILTRLDNDNVGLEIPDNAVWCGTAVGNVLPSATACGVVGIEWPVSGELWKANAEADSEDWMFWLVIENLMTVREQEISPRE